MQTRKLVPFIRVSSVSQRENASREVQEAVIAAWAKAQVNSPVELLPPVSVVESATCVADDRDQFKAALEQMKDADGMIFYAIDRFFRNTEEGLRVAREHFIEQDKYFISVSENIDISTDEGWFMFTIMLAVAEKEAQTIKKRFRNGKAAKRAKGGYLGGETPYGWASNGEGELVEVAEEQEIRKMILSEPDSNSALSIAKRLNDAGYKTRKGAAWSHKQVLSIRQRNGLLLQA